MPLQTSEARWPKKKRASWCFVLKGNPPPTPSPHPPTAPQKKDKHMNTGCNPLATGQQDQSSLPLHPPSACAHGHAQADDVGHMCASHGVKEAPGLDLDGKKRPLATWGGCFLGEVCFLRDALIGGWLKGKAKGKPMDIKVRFHQPLGFLIIAIAR